MSTKSDLLFKRYTWAILFILTWLIAFGIISYSTSSKNWLLSPIVGFVFAALTTFVLYVLVSIGARIRQKVDRWREMENWKKGAEDFTGDEKNLLDIIDLVNEQRIQALKTKIIPSTEEELDKAREKENLFYQEWLETPDTDDDNKKTKDAAYKVQQKLVLAKNESVLSLRNELAMLYSARVRPLFLEIKQLLFKVKVNEQKYTRATMLHRQWWYFLQGFSLVVSLAIPIVGGLGTADERVQNVLNNIDITTLFIEDDSDEIQNLKKSVVTINKSIDNIGNDIRKIDSTIKVFPANTNNKKDLQKKESAPQNQNARQQDSLSQKLNIVTVTDTKKPNAKDVITILLIILPTLSAVSANIIIRFRLSDLWLIRDKGRIDYRKLAEEGRQRLLTAKNAQDLSELHSYINDSMRKIEDTQQVRFFSVPDPSHSADSKTST